MDDLDRKTHCSSEYCLRSSVGQSVRLLRSRYNAHLAKTYFRIGVQYSSRDSSETSQNYIRPYSSVGQSDRLLSDRPKVRILLWTPANNAESLYFQGFSAFFIPRRFPLKMRHENKFRKMRKLFCLLQLILNWHQI